MKNIGKKYWGNRAAGILAIAEDTGKILVGLRSNKVMDGETWGTIGGKIEEDETPEEGALREFREETGYTGSIQLIPAYVYTDDAADFEYYNFIGIIPSGKFKLDSNWETTQFDWLTFEELRSLRPKHPGLAKLINQSTELIEETVLKKAYLKFFAALDQDILEIIYELTYKYGWIVSEERHEGWLPDKAYLEKAKIESALGSWIDHGLEELDNTYAEWLEFHLPEGWVDAMLETTYGQDLNALVAQFDWWAGAATGVLSSQEIRMRIVEAAWKALGGADFFKQDTSYIYETFGPDFIESYLADLHDVETAEKLEEEWEEVKEAYAEHEIAESFIYDNDLENEFEEYLESIDYGGLDWFVDLHSLDTISDQFPNLLQNRKFFEELYHVYLENFPGLEKEIEGIAQTKREIENARGGSLSDKIIAFQVGLTTVHHHGIMADHLLEVAPGKGGRILDEISSGPNIIEWDKDLTDIFGYKPGEAVREIVV